MIVYLNGAFLPQDEVHISPDDRGFLFADGAYEVVRSYDGRLFRLHDHLQRLQRSLREIRIEPPDLDSLAAAAHQLVRRNGLLEGDATVYFQVTRGTAPRKHVFPPPGTPSTLYVTASPFQPAPDKWEKGVAVILVPDIRWTRCDIKSLLLLPNVLASQQARERGAEEALFVRDGFVTEGAHTNFCAVLDGTLVTHPANHLILDGITRRLILDLCADLGIPTRQAPIPVAELSAAAELMIVGTTVEIKPVIQVDDWPVANGRPGSITRRLQAAFRALVASAP
ncbi:MAG: D-amino acid aminotransferase [Anaerolineae bacterium]|nr:D-amino acid aminotransferase [Anaerolineae bacterium]